MTDTPTQPAFAGPAVSVVPSLPDGMTREQAVLSIRELRDLATAAHAEADLGFVRWPVLDALIDHIAEHGLPPNAASEPRR